MNREVSLQRPKISGQKAGFYEITPCFDGGGVWEEVQNGRLVIYKL